MPDQQSDVALAALLAPGPRPGTERGMVDAAHSALDAALAVARGGDLQQARQLCAAAIFEQQPTITADAAVLRAAVHALLVARAFRLLARLVMAAGGRVVQVVLISEHPGPALAPQRRATEPEGIIYALDPAWIETISPKDAEFRDWCDGLMGWTAADREAAPTRRLKVA